MRERKQAKGRKNGETRQREEKKEQAMGAERTEEGWRERKKERETD